MSEWKHELGEYVIPTALAMSGIKEANVSDKRSLVAFGGRIIERTMVECPGGIQRYYMIETNQGRHTIQEGGLMDYGDYLDKIFKIERPKP